MCCGQKLDNFCIVECKQSGRPGYSSVFPSLLCTFFAALYHYVLVVLAPILLKCGIKAVIDSINKVFIHAYKTPFSVFLFEDW